MTPTRRNVVVTGTPCVLVDVALPMTLGAKKLATIGGNNFSIKAYGDASIAGTKSAAQPVQGERRKWSRNSGTLRWTKQIGRDAMMKQIALIVPFGSPNLLEDRRMKLLSMVLLLLFAITCSPALGEWDDSYQWSTDSFLGTGWLLALLRRRSPQP